MQRWEQLNALKEAKGELKPADELVVTRLTAQMQIIFDDANLDMNDAEVC